MSDAEVQIYPPDHPIARRTIERLARFRALHDLLEAHREEWTRAYPHLWVAVGPNGVEASASTQEELLELVDFERVKANDLVLEPLEVNPPRLALRSSVDSSRVGPLSTAISNSPGWESICPCPSWLIREPTRPRLRLAPGNGPGSTGLR